MCSGSKKVVLTAHGLVPPVFTPLFDDQVTVNHEVIPVYAHYLANNGIKAILVGGTTGQHMCLSLAERKGVVDAWMAAAKTTGLHVMVQVGGAPLPDVQDLARYCQSVGVDSLLTLPDLYFKPTSVEELVSNVQLVAAAAPDLPVLYYNIPRMSGVQISMPSFVKAATARIPNFRGLKFSSNDLSEAAEVLRNLEEDQEMFLGAGPLLAPGTLLGVRSSISPIYNLFPRLAQEVVDAVQNCDPRHKALQEKLTSAIRAHNGEGALLAAMKVGMEIATGIKVGPPSLPLKPISEDGRKKIEENLRRLGTV